MIITKHSNFTKATTDCGKPLARINLLSNGTFACVLGSDFSNQKIAGTREIAEAWLAAALVPHALAGA